MSSLIKNTALRQIDFGNLVTRSAQALPQSATANIFTVSGGRVLITAFAGLVTSALGATVTTLKISTAPTVGAGGDLCTTSAITSLAAGSTIALPAAVGSALVIVSTGAYTNPSLFGFGDLLVPAGTITATTSASDTGQIQWDLIYVPFDSGSSVAAA